MRLRTQPHPRITTKDSDGQPNGYLIPIFNEHDGFLVKEDIPKQVYLTVCEPGKIKGPHLHYKRRGVFTCIQGDIRIVVKTVTGYQSYFSGENYDYTTVEVPPGIPAALQNISSKPALILNMPSPAWQPHDQDEHDVVFDESAFIWPELVP